MGGKPRWPHVKDREFVAVLWGPTVIVSVYLPYLQACNGKYCPRTKGDV